MSSLRTLLAFAILICVIVAPIMLMVNRGRTPPTPPVLLNTPTLAEAMRMSRSSGRPVMAFATADWCPPCREMKASTLRDERVERLLRDRTIPVYVNVDHDPEAAAKLRVMGIPATVIIAGETIVARSEGYLEAGNYLSFLESAIDLASKPEEVEKLKAAR